MTTPINPKTSITISALFVSPTLLSQNDHALVVVELILGAYIPYQVVHSFAPGNKIEIPIMKHGLYLNFNQKL